MKPPCPHSRPRTESFLRDQGSTTVTSQHPSTHPLLPPTVTKEETLGTSRVLSLSVDFGVLSVAGETQELIVISTDLPVVNRFHTRRLFWGLHSSCSDLGVGRRRWSKDIHSVVESKGWIPQVYFGYNRWTF